MKLWLLVLCLLTAPAGASDGVPAAGRLTDKEFYDLATCGAPKGGKCVGPRVRWPKRQITVAMHPDTGGMGAAKSARIATALDAAISAINAAGSGIQMVRDDTKHNPNIVLRRVALREGGITKGIPGVPDGEVIGVGYNVIWWGSNHFLTKGTLLISAAIERRDETSVVLEELFQALGFLFDVEGSYYETRSILAQDSNETTKITGQDAAILRLHYPPKSN